MTEPQYGWRSTGFQQQAPGNMHRAPEYDPRSGDHLWMMLTMYRVDPEGGQPILDMENLLSVQGPGCFYCEEPYSARLSKRRCPGKPRHP